MTHGAYGAIFTKNLQDAKRFRSEPDAKRYAKALTLGSGAALVPRKVVRSIALQCTPGTFGTFLR